MIKALLSVLTLTFAFSVANAQATDPALKELKRLLNRFGKPEISGTAKVADKQLPLLKFGPKKINANYDIVDSVKKSKGGTATVFVKDGEEFIRIATNVLKEDGTRAVGTPLARNKAYESVNAGQTFCGEVEILKKPYDTCYEPIKDSAGKVIGIYYVGFPKKS